MASRHDTKVDLLSGPSNGDMLVPGQRFGAKVSMIPRNHFPSAITQVFLYVGPRDGDKQVRELMNCTPGPNPVARNFEHEFNVPHDIVSAGNSVFLEFGWAWDMQYTWADALRNFQNGKCKGQGVLLTLQVTQPVEYRTMKDCNEAILYDIKADLLTLAQALDRASLIPQGAADEVVEVTGFASESKASTIIQHVTDKVQADPKMFDKFCNILDKQEHADLAKMLRKHCAKLQES